MLDVAGVGGFDDGVHVAQGEGNEGAGDAATGDEDRVGIGAGVAAAGFVLEGELVSFGNFLEFGDEFGVVGGAVGESGAFAERDFSDFGGFEAGGVGGVGDVEADGELGLDLVGRHDGAVTADFFLNGVEADEGEGDFSGGEAFEDLGEDVAADAVVERARNEAVRGNFEKVFLINGGLSDADAECGDFFWVAGADIDPQLVDGGDFFVAAVAAEVDGSVADDAGDVAVGGENVEAATACGGDVAAADAVEPEEAVVVDVLDHVADFVGVSGEHDDAIGRAAFDGPGGAVGVAHDLVRKFADEVCPDALAGHFKSGWAGGSEEGLQERGVWKHDGSIRGVRAIRKRPEREVFFACGNFSRGEIA